MASLDTVPRNGVVIDLTLLDHNCTIELPGLLNGPQRFDEFSKTMSSPVTQSQQIRSLHEQDRI